MEVFFHVEGGSFQQYVGENIGPPPVPSSIILAGFCPSCQYGRLRVDGLPLERGRDSYHKRRVSNLWLIYGSSLWPQARGQEWSTSCQHVNLRVEVHSVAMTPQRAPLYWLCTFWRYLHIHAILHAFYGIVQARVALFLLNQSGRP